MGEPPTLDRGDRIEDVAWRRSGRGLVARLVTERGVAGVGEASHLEHPHAVAAALQALSAGLRGRSPWRPDELFYEALNRFGYRDAVALAALSAIDQACWDLRSRALGVPLYEALGGAVRSRVRALAAISEADPETTAAEFRRAREEGYTAFKVIPFCGDYTTWPVAQRVRRAVEVVAAAREAVGWDADLGVELHRDFDPLTLTAFLVEVAPLRPLFVEDPFPPYSLGAVARGGDWTANLALGERNMTVWEFRDLSDLPTVAILRADAGLCGGIGQFRRIAAVAESRHQKLWPHNFGGPVSAQVHIQLAAALPNVDVVEYGYGAIGRWVRGAATPDAPRAGWFEPSEAPGLGADFDQLPDSLDGQPRPVPRAADGGLYYR